MATLAQLEQALVGAHKAGDADASRRLAKIIGDERTRREGDIGFQINIQELQDMQVPGTVVESPEPTLGERVVGAGEAALTVGTGATTGTLGYIGGALKGIAEEIISGRFGRGRAEEEALKGAEALTYAPRTEAGQEIVEAVGEAIEPLAAVAPAIAPLAGEAAVISAATRAAAPVARTAVQERVVAPVTRAAEQAVTRVKEAIPTAVERPAPGTAPSVGAAGVEKAVVRQAQAEELPVPIKLTEAQKTRTFEQQRFERETAKLPEEGALLRERFAQQNEQLQQNLDEFIDATGAELTDLRGVGEIVDKTLRVRAAKDKTKIRTLYKQAEKSGEMEDPVTLNQFTTHLIESAPEAEVANVLKAVKAKAVQLGAVVEGPDGELVPHPVTLKTAELLRRSINSATNAEPTNIRQASIMKKLIDGETEDAGGKLYKRARAARTKYAREYENVGLVKRLIGTKRGSDDRAIAMEDVLRKTILDPSTSLDEMRHVRRLLQTKGGEPGKQAWRELQGATIRHIQEQTTKGVTRDQAGNQIVSPAQLDRAISQLDRSGKLDYVFGKKGAEQLRVINDVAKDVLTAPPGAVNVSNTATVLAGLMDVAISGTAGVPVPIMTSFRMLTKSIRDAKLKSRIKRALGE